MNPFKIKQPVRNKLVNRFNTSMTSRNETDQAHRLNLSRQADQNIGRYRNHINYLEYRLEQHQATIQKLTHQIETNINHQAKLNAQIVRLQRENKNMLNSLYDAENKITEMEEQFNHQMLQQSIQKIDFELSMSQARKRSKISESIENPEKSKRSFKYVQKSSIETDKQSIKQESMASQFAIISQIFSMQIKPNDVMAANISNQDVKQLIQSLQRKQSDLKLQTARMTKLQEAIYYLKKLLKDKQIQYEQQLKKYKDELFNEKQNMQQQMKRLQESNKTKRKQLEQKIKHLEKEIEDKDEEIIQTQQKYSVELKDAEQVMVGLNQQMQSIMKKNQQQIGKLYLQGETYKQNVIQVQKERDVLKDNLRVIEERLHIKSSDLIDMENQLNQITIIKTQNQQIKEKLKQKQKQLQQMNQKMQKLQFELKQADQKMTDTKQTQKTSIDLTVISKVKQQYEQQLVCMKTELQRKDSRIQQQQKKYSALCKRITQLEQSYEKMSKKQNELCSNLNKITKQVYQLEQIKQSQQKQINKLNSSIRNCQGQIAQKDYMVNTMTQQMLLIKQKFQIQKIEAQSQCQSHVNQIGQNQGQIQKVNMQQLHEQFSMILKQKQQQQYQLHSDLQKQRSTCEQLQKQVEHSSKQIQKYQIQLQAAQHRIEQLEQSISRYENELEDHKHQIRQMKKTIHDLQEKQAFFEDYISNMKANDA